MSPTIVVPHGYMLGCVGIGSFQGVSIFCGCIGQGLGFADGCSSATGVAVRWACKWAWVFGVSNTRLDTRYRMEGARGKGVKGGG